MVNLRRLRRITKKSNIKHARLRIAQEKGQQRRIGKLEKKVARLDNKKEIMELRKQLAERRKERKRLRGF